MAAGSEGVALAAQVPEIGSQSRVPALFHVLFKLSDRAADHVGLFFVCFPIALESSSLIQVEQRAAEVTGRQGPPESP